MALPGRKEFKNPSRARTLPNVPGAAMRSASECDRWATAVAGLTLRSVTPFEVVSVYSIS